MKKVDNKMIARAFKKARQYLSDTHCDSQHPPKREYICHALEYAWYEVQISGQVIDAAKNVIRSRLNGDSCLKSWMTEQSNLKGAQKKVNDDYMSNMGRKMQATRLAWLNSMIVEFGGVV